MLEGNYPSKSNELEESVAGSAFKFERSKGQLASVEKNAAEYHAKSR